MATPIFLVQQSEGRALRSWQLKEGSQLVGRKLNCEIVIDDITISRQHARLIVEEGTVTLVDLDSRNGTFVDGFQVQSVVVRLNSEVEFGRIKCILSHVPTIATLDHELFSTLPCAPPVRVPELESLSPKKQLVLQLLLEGLSEKEIAGSLKLSPNTVHHHVTDLYRAFGVASRAELLAQFVRK